MLAAIGRALDRFWNGPWIASERQGQALATPQSATVPAVVSAPPWSIRGGLTHNWTRPGRLSQAARSRLGGRYSPLRSQSAQSGWGRMRTGEEASAGEPSVLPPLL